MDDGIEAPDEPPDWPLLLPLEPEDPPLGMLELLPPPAEPEEPLELGGLDDGMLLD